MLIATFRAGAATGLCALYLLASIVGCSSNAGNSDGQDSGGSSGCTASSRCLPGTVCREASCTQVPCVRDGADVCASGQELCVDGARLDPPIEGWICTAIQCSQDGSLRCVAGQVCLDGLCEFPSPSRDVLQDAPPQDLPGDSSPGFDAPITEDVPSPTAAPHCKPCSNAGECSEGFQCLPIGSNKHCLATCEDGGDCPSGYFCHQGTATSRNCIPVGLKCQPCAFANPCEDGLCCDFSTGACKPCRTHCHVCSVDYDCAPGLRCLRREGQVPGACVDVCGDGAECSKPLDFTCVTNDQGVELCQPNGETCDGCAPGLFPKPDGTGCVACLNSSHCGNNQACDPATNTCVIVECYGAHKCDDDLCHQCCEDAHCNDIPGATGVCLPNGTCEGAAPCDGQCAGQYPVCEMLNGIEQCVQCKTDADCASIDAACTCTGEPLYSCMFPDGSVCFTEGGACASLCQGDADCPPGPNLELLSCYKSGTDDGICYHANGACDNITSCCGAGQTCFDVMAILFGGMGPGMPGMPGGSGPSQMGYCSCDSQHPCLGGQVCTQSVMVCLIPILKDTVCVNGQLPSTMPESLCIDLAAMLGGLI